MDQIEPLGYSTAAGTADIAAASPAAVPPRYASIAAALAAVAGSVFIAFESSRVGSGGPTRAVITAVADATGDNLTTREDLYLVLGSTVDGHTGIVLLKLGQAVWTHGTVEVLDGRVGSVSGGANRHKWAKSVAFTSTSVLEALVGLDVAAVSPGAEPAALAVPDVGPALGILRVMAKGGSSPAAGVAPMHARWR